MSLCDWPDCDEPAEPEFQYSLAAGTPLLRFCARHREVWEADAGQLIDAMHCWIRVCESCDGPDPRCVFDTEAAAMVPGSTSGRVAGTMVGSETSATPLDWFCPHCEVSFEFRAERVQRAPRS